MHKSLKMFIGLCAISSFFVLSTAVAAAQRSPQEDVLDSIRNTRIYQEICNFTCKDSLRPMNDKTGFDKDKFFKWLVFSEYRKSTRKGHFGFTWYDLDTYNKLSGGEFAHRVKFDDFFVWTFKKKSGDDRILLAEFNAGSDDLYLLNRFLQTRGKSYSASYEIPAAELASIIIGAMDLDKDGYVDGLEFNMYFTFK